MCSLGIYDTYVAIFTDGSAKWSLGDEYPGLLKILRRVRQGDLVVCISLSVALLGNSKISYLGLVRCSKSLPIE